MTVPTSTAISACVLTRNEERHIERCLKSLSWADEILVIDAGSTDRTREIACAASTPWAGKLRFEVETWRGFRHQRNAYLNRARYDWILVVDADEAVSDSLRAHLQTWRDSPSGPPHRAFKIRRLEYFLGKPIEHGIWNPSYQDRFFHRAGVEYINEIHEYPRFSVPAQLIHEPLLHSPDFAPDKFLDKMNRYTSLEARDRVAQGQRTNAFRLLGAFPAMFLKNYFYYGAYKDGFHGLVISLLEGVSRVVRHVKMWQFQRELGSTQK